MRKPLYSAIVNNDPVIVQLLLKNGANPNLTSQNVLTPLKVAVLLNRIECAELLFAYGADFSMKNVLVMNDAKPKTLLHVAISYENYPMVDLLLEAEKKNSNNITSQPNDLLHYAILYGYYYIVETLLVNHHLNPNWKYCGQLYLHYLAQYTPLYLALKLGFTTIADLLSQHGAIM